MFCVARRTVAPRPRTDTWTRDSAMAGSFVRTDKTSQECSTMSACRSTLFATAHRTPRPAAGISPTGNNATPIGADCLERLQKRESTPASCGHLIRFTPHVDFVLVLVGYAESEPVIKPARGIDFHQS